MDGGNNTNGHRSAPVSNAAQDPDNLKRVATALGRSVEECEVFAYVFCRMKALESVHVLRSGLLVKEEEIAVMIPLETWNSSNGLFADIELSPGQDICVGGSEQLVLPGTGGCRVIILCLRKPREHST